MRNYIFDIEMEKQKEKLERHNNEIAELREMVRQRQEQLNQQIREQQSHRSSDNTCQQNRRLKPTQPIKREGRN